ncbi:hypothetical protein Leryth_020752, partial [Lithospermum erythrorhizon]
YPLTRNLHGYFKREGRDKVIRCSAPSFFCIEYLSRLLKVKTRRDVFSFHPKCQGAHITHLAFVDDLMLFSYGDMASVEILMTCLETFEGVSGLSFNPAKSSISLAGVKEDRKRSILERVGFSVLSKTLLKESLWPLLRYRSRPSLLSWMLLTDLFRNGIIILFLMPGRLSSLDL